MAIDIAAAAIRALSLVAMLQAAGMALFIALFQRRLSLSASSIRRSGRCSALIALLLIVAHHGLIAARMTGELADVWDGSLQWQLLRSSAGIATVAGGLGLLLIAVNVDRRDAIARVLRIAGPGIVTGSFLLTGHTSTHTPRWALAGLLWTHLSIAAFWLGALPGLLCAARREPLAAAAGLIAAFTAVATGLVPLIALAGIGMALLLLPNAAALRQPYGELLLVKLGLFAALMGLAALNKWRLGPRLASGGAAALAPFRRSVIGEYLLITGVLAVTANLTTFFSPEP